MRDWIKEVENPAERKWEEFYRNRFQHDKRVRTTHGVNCTGSCSWEVFVKDGIVTWELQATDYPSLEAGLPPRVWRPPPPRVACPGSFPRPLRRAPRPPPWAAGPWWCKSTQPSSVRRRTLAGSAPSSGSSSGPADEKGRCHARLRAV